MPIEYFETVPRPPDKRKKEERRTQVQEFNTIADTYDLTPEQLAQVIASSVPAQEQFNYQLQDFESNVYDFFGTKEELEDPQSRAMLFEAWQSKRKFEYWNTQFPINDIGPDTIMTTLSLPEVASRATAEIFQRIADIYGGEYTAAALQTALIDDPEEREATWAILEQIALKSAKPGDFAPSGKVGSAAGFINPISSYAATGKDPRALIQSILEDPASFDDLSALEQRVAIEVAGGTLEGQQTLETEFGPDFAAEIVRARGILMTQKGYKQELTKDELKILRFFVSEIPTNEAYEITGADFFTQKVDVAEAVGQFGITQFAAPSSIKTFTFNEEHVRANFAEHISVVAFLRQLYPEANFEYGEKEGFLDSLVSVLDQGTDQISAYTGAVFENVSEVIQSLFQSPENRKEWGERAVVIRDLIASGEVADEDLKEAMRSMYEAQDRSEIENYSDLVYKRKNPENPGMSFGDSMTSALAIYPGDDIYDTTHTAFALFGQLAFDPTILLAKFVKPLRLAAKLPLGTKITKSRMAQAIFDSIAMPPDVLLASRRGAKFADGLADMARQYDTPEAFATRINKVFGTEMPYARELAEAALDGGEHLHARLLDWMAGGGGRAINRARLMPQVSDIVKTLELEEKLPATIKNLKATLRRRNVRLETQTPKVIMTERGPGAIMPDVDLPLNAPPVTPVGDGTYIYTASSPERFPEIVSSGGLKPQVTGNLPAALVPPELRGGRLFFADSLNRARELASLGPSGHIGFRVKIKTLGKLTPEQSFSGAYYSKKGVSLDDIEFLAPDGKWHRLGMSDEVAKLTDDIAEKTALLKSLQAQHADLIGEKLTLESIMRGSNYETITPLRELPGHRSLRKLAIGKTPFGKVWDAATTFSRVMPVSVFNALGAPDMARYLAANPIIEKSFIRMAGAFRRAGHDTGAGAGVHFEGMPLREGMLLDEATVQGYKNMRDLARNLGTPDDIIDEWLTNISIAAGKGNTPEVFKAFVQGYERVIDNATRLDSVGKAHFRNLWNTHVSERAASFVKEGRGAKVQSTPTVWTPLFDDADNLTHAGFPAIEADFFGGYTFPSYEMTRDYTSATRAYMTSLHEVGNKFTRGATDLYFGASHLWRSFNAQWARAVLVGRMPLALPARIQLEQAVRIEAFGYSSWVRSPVEWFKSVKKYAEFKLFGDEPAYAFMTIMRDYLDDPVRTLARGGRDTVSLAHDTPAAVRTLAGRIKAYNASPSMRIMLKKGSNKAILEEFKNSPYWKTFQPMWDHAIASHVDALKAGKITSKQALDSYEKIVGRIRLEAKQIIGTGEASEVIRAAIRSGKMKVSATDETIELLDKKMFDVRSGTIITEDANLFSDEMLKLYESGKWKPDVHEFPRSWGDYLAVSKDEELRIYTRATDWMFKNFYARPDLYFGRAPLYRQIAAREYNRLLNLGYSPTRAKEAAKVYGARQTADILFTIGANTSADYTLRSLMPFFPAWKELADTWLLRIPAQVGGGGLVGWAVGAGAVARRIDAHVQFFVDNDILFEEGGQWKVMIPFLAPIIRVLTGLEIDSVSFSAESLTSLLPAPSLSEDDPFWKGLLPSLGAPSSIVLDGMADKFGGFFQDLEDSLTLFGGNQSLGPAAVDYIFESVFKVTPPWMTGGTKEMHDDRRNSAYVDAIRINYKKYEATRPHLEDFKNEEEFTTAEAEWLEDLLEESERDSRKWYFLRGISSAVLPFSIKYQEDATSELSAIWDVINGIEKQRDKFDLSTPLLEAYREAHPQLELYLTGKSVTLVGDNPNRVDTFETFQDEVEEGTRLLFTPEQWLVWSLGKQEEALHRSRMNDIFTKFSSTPQRWLLSGFEATAALRKETSRWDAYLGQTELLADKIDVRNSAGEPTSFAAMYESFYKAKKNRYGKDDVVSLTLEQEWATTTLEGLDALAPLFGVGQYTDDSYAEVRRTLNEVLDKDYDAKSPVFRSISWWWDSVRPYFDAKDKVWTEIKATPTPARAPLYRQLAAIENEWAVKKLKYQKYGVLPNPQTVMFEKLSPDAKELKKYDWATLPIEFLSRFQRQKVYGESPKDDQLDELLARVGENERLFELVIDTNAVSPSSKDYDYVRAQTDRKNMEDAKELGVAGIYQKWQVAPYKRVDTLVNNPYWTAISQYVSEGYQLFASQDISVRGGTPAAVEFQRRVVATVEDFRTQDEEFDRIMGLLEIAYGEGPDDPAVKIDTYWPLFFDGFGTPPGYLLYS